MKKQSPRQQIKDSEKSNQENVCNFGIQKYENGKDFNEEESVQS